MVSFEFCGGISTLGRYSCTSREGKPTLKQRTTLHPTSIHFTEEIEIVHYLIYFAFLCHTISEWMPSEFPQPLDPRLSKISLVLTRNISAQPYVILLSIFRYRLAPGLHKGK
jgi:hypothetical protein